MNLLMLLTMLFTWTIDSGHNRNVTVEPEAVWTHPVVRVKRIFLRADDRSQLHRHGWSLLVIPLQEGAVLEGLQANSYISWQERSGNLLAVESITHTLYNAGPHHYTALEIEFRGHEPDLLIPRFTDGSKRQAFGLPGFTITRYALAPGEIFEREADCGGVTLAMSHGLLNAANAKYPVLPGDVLPPGLIENAGGPTSLLAVCPIGAGQVTKSRRM